MRRRTGLVFLLLALAGLALAGGAELYQQNCAACHGPDGKGVPGAFPPLANNPHAADPGYVARVIREGKSGPITVNGQPYNGAMPPFAQLSDDDVRALAKYVATALAGGRPAPASRPAPTAAGDPAAGRAYFLGQRRFTNGGPPCVACHNAGGIGALGGGALGPDLSQAGRKFGSSLPALIERPGFRVMRAVYAGKPLTPAEARDVAAFLEKAPNTGPSLAAAGGRYFLLGSLGLLVLFLILLPFWPRQRLTYRDLLRRKS